MRGRKLNRAGWRNVSFVLAAAATAAYALSTRAWAVTERFVGTQPGDYSSIQAAVNASSDGDIVTVRPGTWNGTVSMQDKNITLRSTDPSDPDVVNSTYVFSDGASWTIKIDAGNNGNTLIDGLKISGASDHGIDASDTGGGGSTAVIDRCLIVWNGSGGGGGGVYMFGGTLSRCRFEHNSCSSGQGGGGGALLLGGAVVDDCEFTSNSSGDVGGGIATVTSTVAIEIMNCTFDGNTASGGGGGVHANGPLDLHDNTFTDNEAGAGGGLAGGTGTVEDNTFEGNSATGDGGAVSGFSGTFSENVLSDNTAGDDGGAVSGVSGTFSMNQVLDNTAGDEGGGLAGGTGTVELNTFDGNSATTNGGAVSGFSGTFSRNRVFDNSAGDDGGGLAGCSGGLIVNNQIYQNAAGPSSGDNGGGLYDCDSDIRNNTIISNHCSGSGGGMRNCDGTGVNIRSNIIYFNTADQGANQLSNCNDPSWCCIENWNGGGSGNRGGDPELANISPIFAHTLWDLRLTAASTSCIDKGSDSNAPTIDFDNNARPFNNTGVSNGTGGTTDIGCFERRIND